MKQFFDVFSKRTGFDNFIILIAVLGIIVGILICLVFRYGKEQSTKNGIILTGIPLDDGKKKKINQLYRIYDVITEILPLLGTLGTVIALINIAADLNTLQTNFLYALTSTFFGLVGAIAMKLFAAVKIYGLMKRVNDGEEK